MGRYRTLKGPVFFFILGLEVIGITFAILNVFQINFLGLAMREPIVFYAGILGAFCPLIFLYIPATAKASRDKIPWYDTLAAALCLYSGGADHE